MSQLLDLRLLRYFIAVAEEGNVGRAAQRLCISQSPLSRQIKELEQRLGLVLFERVRQRLLLTATGHAFLEEARGMLAHAAQVEQRARRWAQADEGSLMIGFVEAAIFSDFLSRSLQRLRADYPAVQVELRAMRSAPQCEAIRRRELDLGLVYNPPPVDDAELTSNPIVTERLLLALPAGHPLQQCRTIRPQDLDRAAWIALPRRQNVAARERFLASCRQAGFEPDIRHEAAEVLTVLGLVSAGMGLALVQEGVASMTQFPRVVFRPLDWFPASVAVHLVYRRGSSELLLKRFLDVIEMVAG
ncbi:LysR substrate-binding domain-containing protein [Paraherbaspirillum soli]|uniref:LysR substrate-binding domain-containing protein n=1 Tax=Paraherbaspirillum soli TaxID=631222 RepID=A0ABW0M701_9BURK